VGDLQTMAWYLSNIKHVVYYITSVGPTFMASSSW
jgi:hypothetical protein